MSDVNGFLKVGVCAGEEYLVTLDGYLVYLYAPSADAHIPKLGSWPQSSYAWVAQWKPVISPKKFTNSQLSGRPDIGLFSTESRQGGPSGPHHVKWGGDRTKDKDGAVVAYWGLYTFEDDDRLDSYKMLEHGDPPGFIKAVWTPARADQGAPKASYAVLNPSNTGPININASGGP